MCWIPEQCFDKSLHKFLSFSPALSLNELLLYYNFSFPESIVIQDTRECQNILCYTGYNMLPFFYELMENILPSFGNMFILDVNLGSRIYFIRLVCSVYFGWWALRIL